MTERTVWEVEWYPSEERVFGDFEAEVWHTKASGEARGRRLSKRLSSAVYVVERRQRVTDAGEVIHSEDVAQAVFVCGALEYRDRAEETQT